MTDRAPRVRVLVVDDQLAMAETIADGLVDRGFDAFALASSRDAGAMLADDDIDALVTDMRMPAVDGMGLLARSKKHMPDRPVIIMTAYGAIDSAVESIRQGAYHYLTKPFSIDELALFLSRALDDRRLRRETTALRRALGERFSPHSILAKSPAMQELLSLVERLIDSDASVLIVGETGTGKGLIARTLHAQGRRAASPFVTVNCAAIPESLLESELLGHVRGAFTGATANRRGMIEEAQGGVLFLDEVGEIPLAVQAKLLDVLERRRVRAVGANQETEVDMRVIAATHRDLHERVRAGAFREDLLYRLDVVTLEVPPLRHRREDIPELAEQFLLESRQRHALSRVERFSREVLDGFAEYPWPGNVRELRHVVERAVVLGSGTEIVRADLPPNFFEREPRAARFSGPILPMREMQRLYAGWALEQLGGRRMLAAEKLDIDPKTLAKWLIGQ